jgi:hypothetical protein
VDGVMLHPNKLSRTFPNVLIWKNLPWFLKEGFIPIHLLL